MSGRAGSTDLKHSAVSLRIDAPIDFPQLLQRCLGNEGLARQIAAKFHGRIDVDAALLEDALHRRDALQLASVAHRIKGTAANVAAAGICEAADAIEQRARDGKLEQIPSWLTRFKSEGRRLTRMMDRGEIRFDQGEFNGES